MQSLSQLLELRLFLPQSVLGIIDSYGIELLHPIREYVNSAASIATTARGRYLSTEVIDKDLKVS